MRLILVFSLFLSVALSATSQTHTFIIEGMSCQSCANTAEAVLKKIKGVKSAEVIFSTKTATVTTSKKITPADLERILKRETNFEVLLEGENLPTPLTEAERSGPTFLLKISHQL